MGPASVAIIPAQAALDTTFYPATPGAPLGGVADFSRD